LEEFRGTGSKNFEMVSVFLGNYARFKKSTYKERNVFADDVYLSERKK